MIPSLMADLLHEYWENDTGDGEFCPVKATNDATRQATTPQARLIFAVHAGSWFAAMQLYHDRLGYGRYVPPAGGLNHHYSDAEKAEQDAYLLTRPRT